jgi:hypothetical protein
MVATTKRARRRSQPEAQLRIEGVDRAAARSPVAAAVQRILDRAARRALSDRLALQAVSSEIESGDVSDPIR